jgi:hypothetical protein
MTNNNRRQHQQQTLHSQRDCREEELFENRTIKPPTKYLNYAIISAWKKEMQEH